MNWTTITDVTNQTGWSSGVRRTYTANPGAAYRYYRLEFYGANDLVYVQLNTVRMFTISGGGADTYVGGKANLNIGEVRLNENGIFIQAMSDDCNYQGVVRQITKLDSGVRGETAVYMTNGVVRLMGNTIAVETLVDVTDGDLRLNYQYLDGNCIGDDTKTHSGHMDIPWPGP